MYEPAGANVVAAKDSITALLQSINLLLAKPNAENKAVIPFNRRFRD